VKDFVIHRIAWHIEGDPRGHEVAADLVLAYAPLVWEKYFLKLKHRD